MTAPVLMFIVFNVLLSLHYLFFVTAKKDIKKPRRTSRFVKRWGLWDRRASEIFNRLQCITIDGPAGAGKSSVARLLAETLTEKNSASGIRYEYIDTGSLYRAVALAALRLSIDSNFSWDDAQALEKLAKSVSLDIRDGKTFLNGEDVTFLLRSPEVTEKTRYSANNIGVREILGEIQRKIAARYISENRGIVTEGRDQGTAVFPNADFKFFVTATPEERARRRCGEWKIDVNSPEYAQKFEEVLNEIVLRDHRDASRKFGPLLEPADSIRIETDSLTIEQVVSMIISAISKKIGDSCAI